MVRVPVSKRAPKRGWYRPCALYQPAACPGRSWETGKDLGERGTPERGAEPCASALRRHESDCCGRPPRCDQSVSLAAQSPLRLELALPEVSSACRLLPRHGAAHRRRGSSASACCGTAAKSSHTWPCRASFASTSASTFGNSMKPVACAWPCERGRARCGAQQRAVCILRG